MQTPYTVHYWKRGRKGLAGQFATLGDAVKACNTFGTADSYAEVSQGERCFYSAGNMAHAGPGWNLSPVA